jgi:hypothetical protein
LSLSRGLKPPTPSEEQRQGQKQIPFGNDKQKGQRRIFWLRQNDDFKWLRQNDDVKQAKSTTEILAFDFAQARMTNEREHIPLMRRVRA